MSSKPRSPHLFDQSGVSILNAKHLAAKVEALEAENEKLRRQVHALTNKLKLADVPTETAITLH